MPNNQTHSIRNRMITYLSELVWKESDTSLSRKDWIQSIWKEFENAYPIRITKSSYSNYHIGSKDFVNYLQGLPSLINFPFTYQDIIKCYQDIGIDTSNMDEDSISDLNTYYWHFLSYGLLKIAEEEKIQGRFVSIDS